MNIIRKYGRAAVATLVFAAGFFLFFTAALAFKMDIGDMPAWVQAVGSIVAIVASVNIATHQTRKQRHEDRVRAAQENHRIATFAAEVIDSAVETVRHVEKAQRSTGGFSYIFHDRARLQAAQVLLQAAAADRPFVQLIRPIIEMHTLVISVASAAEQLEGQNHYLSNSRFDLFWDVTNRQIAAVATGLSDALAAAQSEINAVESAQDHS